MFMNIYSNLIKVHKRHVTQIISDILLQLDVTEHWDQMTLGKCSDRIVLLSQAVIDHNSYIVSLQTPQCHPDTIREPMLSQTPRVPHQNINVKIIYVLAQAASPPTQRQQHPKTTSCPHPSPPQHHHTCSIRTLPSSVH